MAELDPTLWVPILATWVLAIGTLVFAYWQLRQNQHLHSASTLLDLREQFYGTRIQQARRTLSTWLLGNERDEEPDNWEVGLFFQLLGSLARSGALEPKMVRSAFGTWITGYYTFMVRPVNLLERWRSESHDPLIFADFEWLAHRIIEYERRMAPGPGFDASLREEARYVLEAETRLSGPL